MPRSVLNGSQYTSSVVYKVRIGQTSQISPNRSTAVHMGCILVPGRAVGILVTNAAVRIKRLPISGRHDGIAGLVVQVDGGLIGTGQPVLRQGDGWHPAKQVDDADYAGVIPIARIHGPVNRTQVRSLPGIRIDTPYFRDAIKRRQVKRISRWRRRRADCIAAVGLFLRTIEQTGRHRNERARAFAAPPARH